MTSHFRLKLLSLPPFSLALHSNEMRSRTSERIQLMRLILKSDLWIISLSFYLNSNYLLSISEIILGSKTPKALLSAVVYQPTRSAFVMSPLTWSDWRHCRGRPCTCSSPPPPSPRYCSPSCFNLYGLVLLGHRQRDSHWLGSRWRRRGRRGRGKREEEGEEEEAEEDSTGGDTGQSRGKAATAAGADTVLPKLI